MYYVIFSTQRNREGKQPDSLLPGVNGSSYFVVVVLWMFVDGQLLFNQGTYLYTALSEVLMILLYSTKHATVTDETALLSNHLLCMYGSKALELF